MKKKSVKPPRESFSEITESKHAEEALRLSEERFAKAFEHNAAGMSIVRLKDGKYMEVNKTWLTMFGYQRQEVLGRTSPEIDLWVQERDRDAMYEALQTKGYVRELELSMKKHSGKACICLVSADVITMNGEEVILASVLDITERKRAEEALRASEERQAYLLRLSDVLRSFSDIKSIQDNAARLLAEHLKVSQSSYTDYSEDYLIIHSEMLNDNTLSMKGTYKRSDLSAGIAILCSGRDVIYSDVLEYSEVPEELRALCLALNIRANITVPIFREGKLVATLSVRQTTPRVWSPDEVELVHETAERTWVAVERARAEEALRESEESFRALVMASSETLYRMSPDWGEMRYLQGKNFIPDTDSPSSSWLDKYIHPDDQPNVLSVINEAIRTKSIFELEHRVLQVDGSLGWTFSRAIPLLDANDEIREWLGTASDITARKQAEAEAGTANGQLARSNQEILNERQRLLGVLETLPVMVCLLTPDYHVAFANRTFREKFGESDGRHCYEYCCGYTDPCPFCQAFVPLKTGQAHHWEFIHPNGNAIFDAYDFPFNDTDGSPMILEMDIDITERKQAENEKILWESYQRNNEILESITDSFYALDHELHFIYINNGAEKAWGIPRTALIDRKIGEAFPEMIDDSLTRFNRVLQEQTPEHCELYSKVTQRWIEMHVYPASNGISVYFRDIHERKQMEESLRKSREALSSERELLKVTINSLREGVVAIDNETRIIFLNEAAANLTGYSQDEAIGKAVNKILYVIDDKTDEPLSEFAPQEVYNHAVLVTCDLREIAISINSSPILDVEGRKIGTVLVIQDITEKQKTEQEMLKTAKLDSLGILAGGVAHDFNNILAGILANLQLAMFKLKKHQDISNYLKTTIEITRKASDLTKQLLTFAKGGDPVKKSTAVVNLVKDTVQFALSGSKVKAEFHLPEDLWIVDIDAGQISQVINNLTINAEQAMPIGGTLEIYGENVAFEMTEHYRPGQYVKLTIKDHGIGIPPKIIDKIFDPFFTTKKAGNGLGLSTSYSIIKKHDGYLAVESEPGIGTAFYILLPAFTQENIWNESKIEIAASGEAKILLMDDEDAIRNVGGEMLFYYGYQVTLAKDGNEAIDLYKKAKETAEPFDIVIMDLTIPGGLGGIETMAILRQFDPEIKAVISSGYASDPVMSEYEKYGFHGVVTKPYVIEELIAILNKVLDRKQLPLDLTF